MPNIPKKIQLVMACAVFFAVLQLAMPEFIFLRDVMTSEPWRWWTAQWVHVGWRHYLLNMVALGCLPFIFSQSSRLELLWAIVVLSPLVSLGLYIFFPHVNAYAGLSGVLHGLYAWAALMVLCARYTLPIAALSKTPSNSLNSSYQQITNQAGSSALPRFLSEKAFAWFVLLGVIIKVCIEKKVGHTDTERLIGAPVLIQAHQIGLVAGIIYFSLLCGWYKFSRLSSRTDWCTNRKNIN